MLKHVLFYIHIAISVTYLLAGQYIHHDLKINLEPTGHFIKVEDKITLPAELIEPEILFLHHGGLDVKSATPDVRVELIAEEAMAERLDTAGEKFDIPQDIPYKLYKIIGVPDTKDEIEIFISYQGKIHHPVQQISKEYARGFSETPGIISEEGVYLAGASYWLPWFNDGLVTFDMTVSVEADWRVISQGKKTEESPDEALYSVRWESPEPMDEVFLIAAKFNQYHKQIGNVNVLAYLRSDDPSLANKYLETTAQYLEMYNKLIGQYPYTKFALIENFWETGYGMPSFTLLGQKVIRFPFILHSSYPHELLHNWWGNSVFVDYDNGNWCEGLTAYMADHLIKEQRGQGAEYRRSALQAYTDYVNDQNEFPLSEFISRTDASSSSIGYNKSMMIFNMLRYEVGDDIFTRAMQKFYRNNKFRRAGFNDIRAAFNEVSDKEYKDFFSQWVNRKGAPVLTISDTRVERRDPQYRLTFTLNQTQKGEPYRLLVPIAVHLSGEPEAKMESLQMYSKKQTFEIYLEKLPLGIDVDPQFDVFRRLHRNEIPPSLSQVFGAEKIVIILPSGENSARLAAYDKLARAWKESDSDKIEIINDGILDDLPSDKAVWVFGLKNKFRNALISGLAAYDTDISGQLYRIGKSSISPANNSIIFAARNPKNQEHVVVWLSADNDAAMPGLGRKLPHYGKYSYLAFEGEEPSNILKGQWPAVNSPMSAAISSAAQTTASFEMVTLPKREALASLAPVFSEKRMLEHIEFLASKEMRGRGLGTPELDRAADYIAAEFKKAGLIPGGDQDSYFQAWDQTGGKDKQQITLKNVIAILPGKNKDWKEQSVVICAHYDHLGLGWPDVRKGNEGKIHYGADDNASGVSVMLEMAQLLGKSLNPGRSIIFVAMTGEESGLIGSRYYINNYKKFPFDKIMGVLNLDTVGRLGENKILILNNSSASEWKHVAMGIGFVTGLPYELVSQDLDASDQVSFIDAGIAAIQIFSGANRDYHSPNDQIEKIDAAGMVKIATFTREAITYLAEREDAMTFTGGEASSKKPAAGAGRKVSSGVMPDFAFQGNGVKAADVAPDSPAAKAGIQKGDIIIKLGDMDVTSLRDYSEALKKHKPEDSTTIIFIHDGAEKTAQITLKAR
jgi:hypothetical protein